MFVTLSIWLLVIDGIKKYKSLQDMLISAFSYK